MEGFQRQTKGFVPNPTDHRGSSETARETQYLKSTYYVPFTLQMHDMIRAVLQEERLSRSGEERSDIGGESKLASLLTHMKRYLNLIVKEVL